MANAATNGDDFADHNSEHPFAGLFKDGEESSEEESSEEASEDPQDKRTLFDIGEELRRLDDLLYDRGGEITDPEVEAAVDAWFDELHDDLSDKVDNYAGLITEMEARRDAREAEAKRLKDLASQDDNAIDSLKERLKLFFQERGIKKIETPRYKVGWRNSGGRLPVNVDDGVRAEDLPKQFQNVSVRISKSAIRAALDEGAKLDFAQFGERGSYLSIR